jgi:hypothetical protein
VNDRSLLLFVDPSTTPAATMIAKETNVPSRWGSS